jgi:hypothetical protein
MMQRPRSVIAGSVAVLLFAHVTRVGAATPTPLGAATPQAVVERISKAATTKNLSEMVACLDEKSRQEMALALVAGATMFVAFMGMGSEMASGMAQGMSEASGQKPKAEDKAKMDKAKAEAKAKTTKAKASLSAVFKKHGLPDFLDEKAKLPEKEKSAEILKNVDTPALVNDLFAFMGTIGEAKDVDPTKDGPIPIPSTADVKNYKISGNKATAKAGAETLEFVKEGDAWFLHPPEKKPEAKSTK